MYSRSRIVVPHLPSLYIDNTLLVESESLAILVSTVNSHLTFEKQNSECVMSAMRKLGIINKTAFINPFKPALIII